MAADSQPLVLDATVLSNFASSDAVDWLAESFRRPVTVPEVRTEIERGREHGHDFLANAFSHLGDSVTVVDAATASGDVRERLDAGEAQVLGYAIEVGGTAATDDLAARRVATARDVPVTGSIGLLVSGIRHDLLDPETADEWLRTWRRDRGYHAPVERIEDALND